MTRITAETSLEELATIVSETLTAAGITAVLGGGGAVTYYSDNRYMSTDLDFITVERNRTLAPVLAELGFSLKGKDFVHDSSKYFLEFPPGPLTFGDRYVDTCETVIVQTKYGELRIITPTQCLMDRLAWVVHGNDPQSRAQAVLVAKHQAIDWDDVYEWSRQEGIDADLIDSIQADAKSGDSN